MIFYLCSTALALYAAYLVLFRVRKVKGNGERTDEGFTFPRIAYLLLPAACFIPILNFMFGMVTVSLATYANYVNDVFYFRSWLLDKPERKESAGKDNQDKQQ